MIIRVAISNCKYIFYSSGGPGKYRPGEPQVTSAIWTIDFRFRILKYLICYTEIVTIYLSKEYSFPSYFCIYIAIWQYISIFQEMNNHRLILIACYLILVFIVFPTSNRNHVFSLLSSMNLKENSLIEEVKSSHRLEHSKQQLNDLDPSSTLHLHKERLTTSHLDHLFVIMARNVQQKRPSRAHYLLPLTMHLHDVVTGDNSTGMIVCDTTTHLNEIFHNLTNYFPTYKIRNEMSSNELINYTNENNILKRSFSNCLKGAIENTNYPRILTIFNENVLPYHYFARDIRELIRTRLDKKISSGEFIVNDDKWLFLHLQEPIQLRLFQCDYESFRELVIVAIIGALTFYLIFRVLEPQMSSSSVLFNALYGAIFFLTFAFCLGRPYLSEIRRNMSALYRIYDPPEPVGFSALTLPTSSYYLMEPQLRTISCSDYVGFHNVLDSLINTLEIPGYIVSPSLVRYV